MQKRKADGKKSMQHKFSLSHRVTVTHHPWMTNFDFKASGMWATNGKDHPDFSGWPSYYPSRHDATKSTYCRRSPNLPHTYACSTIGPTRLNFRVRDGNGWDPRSLLTGKLERRLAGFPAARIRIVGCFSRSPLAIWRHINLIFHNETDWVCFSLRGCQLSNSRRGLHCAELILWTSRTGD